MERRLRILVPTELAETLANKFKLGNPEPSKPGSAAALRLGLEEAAAWITIIVGVGQLAEWAVQLARSVTEWHAAQQRPVTPLLVQGSSDDAAVLVTSETTIEVVGRVIESTMEQ